MTVVKICGITNEEDARVALDAGADMLGFVFFPRSPRYVKAERARDILDSLGGMRGTIRAAGVFVNESAEHVDMILKLAGLDLAQLHGKESAEFVLGFSGRAYKSLQPAGLDEARHLMAHYADSVRGNIPAFIADAPPAKLPGGNGAVGDWSVAREIALEFPILLAGGLTVENVGEAIEFVQPWGVDVSSGVERAPGLKDHARVREFVARAKVLERENREVR